MTQVDGLLADLGMSSMQVDDRDRGFSFMRDGPLDMRMDRTRGRTAAELLATLPAEELAACFRDLGDEPQADAIAAAIVAQRETKPIERTKELRELIEPAAPVRVDRAPGAPPERQAAARPATRVFQALRILVNRELANLQAPAARAAGRAEAGRRGGDHQLPQRRGPAGEGGVPRRAAGGRLRGGRRDDPIRPTFEERTANPRSRSAKLRWARRA